MINATLCRNFWDVLKYDNSERQKEAAAIKIFKWDNWSDVNHSHKISVFICVLVFHHFSTHNKTSSCSMQIALLQGFFWLLELVLPMYECWKSNATYKSPPLMIIGSWCINASAILSHGWDDSGYSLYMGSWSSPGGSSSNCTVWSLVW